MTEAIVTQSPGNLIAPVMNVALARQRLTEFQQFVKEYLVENEDFGIIPGTPKPTLLKPGADKLCELYGLADDYEVTQRTENFETGLFDYEVKCILTAKPGGHLVSTGLGSCNSFEKKYRWREAKRKCPNCGKETIIKGKEEYGGGFVCWAKNGDCCKAKFADTDSSITGQTVGKVQNEDVADLKNTILKMAKKRAKIDATLSATRSSGVFTQDMEDWDIPKAEGVISHPPPQATGTLQPTQQTTQRAATAPAAAQPQGAVLKFIPPNGLTAVIKGVKEIKGLPAKPADGDIPAVTGVRARLIVTLLGQHNGVSEASCFDTKLWPAIKESVGLECHFQIFEGTTASNKPFIRIEDLIYVAGEEYVNGQPVPPPDQQ
jgi:predicted RNA-binding Zn-ribbon protein involved in translation (DUF1610 family)